MGTITTLKGGRRMVQQGEEVANQNGPRMCCCSFISRNEFKWSLNSVTSETKNPEYQLKCGETVGETCSELFSVVQRRKLCKIK